MSQGQPPDNALRDDGPRPWYLGGGAAPGPGPSEARPAATEQAGAAPVPAAASAPAVDVAPWTVPEPQAAPDPEPVPEPVPAAASGWSSPAPDADPVPSWDAVPVAPAPPPWTTPAPVSSPPPGPPPPAPGTPASMPLSPAPTGRGTATSGPSRVVLLGALAIVLVLAVGGGVGWLIRGQGSHTNASDDGGAATAVSTQPTLPTTQPAPTTSASAAPTTVDPLSTEQGALAELGRLRAESLQGLQLDGRWVAQLASKSVGITDPLQTTSSGSHTFYAVDILAESNAARATVPTGDRVLVLSSTDFGKYSTAPDGQAYWVTLVDGGFSGSDAVKAWCSATYPTLDPTALNNACAARTLSPSHS